MTRVALVTGANRGIGFAIARGLREVGLDVIVGARSGEDGRAAADKIGTRSVVLDVADGRSIQAAIEKIGTIDVLVNNAGVLGAGGVFDDPADFETSVTVMVRGPYHLMRLATPAMICGDYGRIVNVSSRWGAFSDGIAGPAAYGVAKAALNALTVSAARSLPGTVKVNAMCPGWVRTRMGGVWRRPLTGTGG